MGGSLLPGSRERETQSGVADPGSRTLETIEIMNTQGEDTKVIENQIIGKDIGIMAEIGDMIGDHHMTGTTVRHHRTVLHQIEVETVHLIPDSMINVLLQTHNTLLP